jgi:hypothetical protein
MELLATDAPSPLRITAPSTLNFKSDPAGLVRLEWLTGERFDTAALLSALPAEQPPTSSSREQAPRPAPRRVDDPLRAIEPGVYVAALTGQQVGRERKVSCPFHRDRTPSLHVYETAEDGWFCFGCRAGGSVYDLGGAVFGLRTRGREFVELRRRLYEVLLPGDEPPAPRHRHRPGVAA